MGVTIESKNESGDLGYFGFNRLRMKVAELCDKELAEHYERLNNSLALSGNKRKMFFESYNKKIAEIVDKNNIVHAIPNFIYASDCGGKVSSEQCKQIYEIVKDYDDEISYGYSGRPDRFMFSDFKDILKDCVENKCDMEWF